MEANNDFYSTFSMRPISVQSPGKPKNQQIQVLSPMVATNSPAITPPMSRTGKSPRNKQLPPLSQTDSALVPYAAEPDFSTKSNMLAIVPVSREDRLLAAEQRQSVLQSELMIMHNTLKNEEDCCRKASEDHQVCVQLLTELRSEKEQLSEACSSTLAESESIKANLHLAESQQRRWYGNFEEMAALHSQEAKDVVRQFDKRWQSFTSENVEVQQTYSLMTELQDVCKANKHLRNEAIFKDLYKRQDELEAVIAQQEEELSKLRKAQKLKAGKSAMAMLASQDSGLARAVFGLWRDDWQAERKARWDREAEQLNTAMEEMNARSKKMVGGAGASLVSSQTEVLTRTVFEVWKNEWKTASSARWAEKQEGRMRHATNAKVDLLKDRFKVIARQVATRWIVSDSTNLVSWVFGEWRALAKVKQKRPGVWQRVKSKIPFLRKAPAQ